MDIGSKAKVRGVVDTKAEKQLSSISKQEVKTCRGRVKWFNRRIMVVRVLNHWEGLVRYGMTFRLDPNVLISSLQDGILKLTGLKSRRKVRVCYVAGGREKRVAKAVAVLRN